MVFESANFIKPYLSTDKFLTILYPDGKRFVTLNAIQNKKVVLNGKKVRAYQEGYTTYNDASTGESISNYDINGIEMTYTLNIIKAIDKKILIIVR